MARLLVTDSTVRNVLLCSQRRGQRGHPLSGNESVLGHDLTGARAGDKEAQTAITRGTMIMAGPFPLVQGGQGIAGRRPCTSTAPLGHRLGDAQLSGGAQCAHRAFLRRAQGFACRIWRVNPDTEGEQTILQSGEGIASRALDYAFPIYNSEWHVTVSPVQPWYANDSVLYSALGGSVLYKSVTRAYGSRS